MNKEINNKYYLKLDYSIYLANSNKNFDHINSLEFTRKLPRHYNKMITAKKEERYEKKKKKMAALAEIVKLNDNDRKKNYIQVCEEKNVISKVDKGLSRCSDEILEPTCKKTKPNEGSNEIKPENKISQEQYKQLKKELNERKKQLKNIPKLRLKLLGESALLKTTPKERTPIFLTDIQHLMMTALLGSHSPQTPWRWCHLEKGNKITHTTVLLVEGLSLFHFSSYESVFKECEKMFEHKLELVMPIYEEGKIFEELATVPLTNSQKELLIKQYGSLEAAMEATQDPTLMMKTVFPVENNYIEQDKSEAHLQNFPANDVFSRTKLLLSPLQMVDENYPLPLRGELSHKYKNYALTKDTYSEVTSHSPMFGIDCEMCRTTLGINELTRISMVNEKYESVYETFVRPENKIVDYLTAYSGITPSMMQNVTKTLTDVHQDMRNILPNDAILVGQSLNVDLHAMKMMHPYVIDTSVIFNITGERRRKSKLQTLAREFLGEIIQQNPLGHDSIEDSSASLKLAKLKLSNGLDFGDAVLLGRKRINEYCKMDGGIAVATTGTDTAKIEVIGNMFGHISKRDRSTAIISSAETNIDYKKYITNAERSPSSSSGKGSDPNTKITYYPMENNKYAVQKTCELAIQHALTLSHLKIPPQRLEMTRIEKTLSNIDQWISKIWENIASNGLFIVILGGVPGASGGVALIDIKKDINRVSA